MSHGFYPEGEGPGTDAPDQAHDRLCQCHICDYENEMEAQDNQFQQELAKFPPTIRRAVEIIAADHRVAHDDYSHRWWMAAVINKGACPLAMDNSLDKPSIQPLETIWPDRTLDYEEEP